MGKLSTALELVEKIRENRLYCLWRHQIEDISHLGVFRNVTDTKNGSEITLFNAVLHTLLEGEQRGVLKKHHGKTAHQTIMQGVVDFSVLAEIVDLIKSIRQCLSEGTEAEMFFEMHLNPLHIV